MTAQKIRLPDFIVIGEQKCGTGWIRDRLREHPGVFMPPGEVKFFSHKANFDRGLAHYAKVFAAAREELVGEKSPEYFWQNSGVEALNPDVFGLIRQTLPEARIVLVLRDPVARAVSALLHHVRHRGRRIHPDLLKTQTADDILLSGRYDFSHLGIVERGYYADRLEQAMDVFGDRLQVLVFERDVLADPGAGLDAICDHIGAPRWDGFSYNQNEKSAKPSYRAMWLSYHLPVLRPLFRTADFSTPMKPTLSPAFRGKMADLYRSDVQRVETLLDSPLIGTWWLK